jgi:hypothetical protein
MVPVDVLVNVVELPVQIAWLLAEKSAVGNVPYPLNEHIAMKNMMKSSAR